MQIFHVSAECYPAAKVGGLADVVGSLPKYLRKAGVDGSVIMPKYQTEWIQNQEYENIHNGSIYIGGSDITFNILKERKDKLGFPLYMVDIPQYFDRAGIYVDPQSGEGYWDEGERFIGFQRAVLQYINSLQEKPDVIHCHDHHAGLIPFMMTECFVFESLKSIPTVLTVHNAEYQGRYPHATQALLPHFRIEKTGLLDWNDRMNSLAAGLKCCWQISTVSPSYMEELQHHSDGLEFLFANERHKSRGILNGIDTEVWNPVTDDYLVHNYGTDIISKGKKKNKGVLCEQFGFEVDRPLISFIGRLVGEKGADLLPDLFTSILEQTEDVSFLVLGTGNLDLHHQFEQMSNSYIGFFDASLTYNEQLAHQIYAGSDFMIIPSRVEPCGLNQMYAMRYGTVPIVRETGGLKDTVQDISQPDGYGITFNDFTLQAGVHAVIRSLEFYKKRRKFNKVRKYNMSLDFSWNASAKTYIKMYKQLTN